MYQQTGPWPITTGAAKEKQKGSHQSEIRNSAGDAIHETLIWSETHRM